MTNEEIKEKYGIEMIGKEMWVWNDDPKRAFFTLVIHRRMNQLNYPYKAVDGTIFRNASETNPNEPKQPQVGDKGFFWDDETYYAYDVISSIINTNGIKDLRAFNAHFSGNYKNFSHEKQPWMK
jgi:hypothetical protein